MCSADPPEQISHHIMRGKETNNYSIHENICTVRHVCTTVQQMIPSFRKCAENAMKIRK